MKNLMNISKKLTPKSVKRSDDFMILRRAMEDMMDLKLVNDEDEDVD